MWIEDGESWPGVVVPVKVGRDLPKQSLRIHKVRAPKPESRLFFLSLIPSSPTKHLTFSITTFLESFLCSFFSLYFPSLISSVFSLTGFHYLYDLLSAATVQRLLSALITSFLFTVSLKSVYTSSLNKKGVYISKSAVDLLTSHLDFVHSFEFGFYSSPFSFLSRFILVTE